MEVGTVQPFKIRATLKIMESKIKFHKSFVHEWKTCFDASLDPVVDSSLFTAQVTRRVSALFYRVRARAALSTTRQGYSLTRRCEKNRSSLRYVPVQALLELPV